LVDSVPNDYPVELTAPDISAYTGNSDVPYFTTIESGVAGPHVGITAVVHGNELCGAIALDHLFKAGVTPKRGALTLGFCNIEAYSAFDPNDPTASRFLDEDFNRVWDVETLEGERDSIELRRAREIRPAIDRIDALLDVHSMQSMIPPLMMAGPLDKGQDLARRIASPAHVVVDSGHAAGRRMRDYDGFGDAASPKNALLIECGQHWQAKAAPVAIDAAYRFLLAHDLIDPGTAEGHLMPMPDEQNVIEVTGPVTIETEDFRFARSFRGMEVLAKGETIAWDGEKEITAPYDGCVLIMPSRRLWKGYTAVRLGRFV
jgi:predicted deacylase